MGCFLGCFGSSKDRKRRKQRNRISPRGQKNGGQKPMQTTESPVAELGITEKATNSVQELGEKSEEQLSLSSRKRVTFDSNVKTYEHVTVYESTDSLVENDKAIEKERKEGIAKSSQSNTNSDNDSITSSVGSYPSNHRYQNCQDSDDEVEELEYGDSDLEDDYDDSDEDGDGSLVCQEVWSESIPTMESRAEVSLRRVASEEAESPMAIGGLPEQDMKTVGLNRNARDRSIYVHSVLNPVENLTQWKAVKSKETFPLTPQQKENLVSDEEVSQISFSSATSANKSSFSFKQQRSEAKNPNQEIAVDASLSNWLVSSEITPQKKVSSIGIETEMSMSQGSTSIVSLEDRPILGALTLEELKQFTASSSPRKSPSRSPDDIPIIGTVGTYWRHTGETKDCGSAASYKGIPNTTSKYSEDNKVKWHSTPFETRLERALNNRGASDA